MATIAEGDTVSNEPSIEKKIENGNKFPGAGDEENEADVSQEMVTSESTAPLKTPLKDVEVKFIVSDSINGDAKIDMDNVKTAFAGMAKEELMKYANDPFWIRMRLCLFIFFWALWVLMFIGAIAIIVVAPRCSVPEKPKWYQQGPLYEVDLPQLNVPDSKNFLDGLRSKLNYFVELNIKGLILSPFFPTLDGKVENAIDFKSIGENFGSIEDFKLLTKEAKEKNVRIILSFVPNHSSSKHSWFEKSVAGELPYKDYYVWAPASGKSSEGEMIPPNNWLSINGGSAWEWNEARKEFYLHQFDVDQPDLNFHNPNVTKEFNETISFWLELGASGFNMDRVQYLLEDQELLNETVGDTKGAIHTEYNFYNHIRTHNRPRVANILSSWRQTIHQKTDGEGVLIITGVAPIPEDMNVTSTIVDLTRNKTFLHLKKDFNADDLYRAMDSVMSSDKWVTVQLGDRDEKRVAERFGPDVVDGLNMLTLLSQGTPITFLGEELGLGAEPIEWGNETNGVLTQKAEKNSHYNVYKTVVDARDSPAIEFGDANLSVVNGTLLTLTRVKEGHPGYLVVFNPTSQNVTKNLSTLDRVPEELTVYARSGNYDLEENDVKDKVKSDSVTMMPKSALVFTFVPEMDAK